MRGLLAPDAHDAVVLLPAGRNAVVRQVRQRRHEVVQIPIEPGELDLHRGDLVAERRGLGLDQSGVTACPLGIADALRDLVAARALVVGLRLELPALQIEREDFVDVRLRLPLGQRLSHAIRLPPNQIDVEHESSRGGELTAPCGLPV